MMINKKTMILNYPAVFSFLGTLFGLYRRVVPTVIFGGVKNYRLDLTEIFRQDENISNISALPKLFCCCVFCLYTKIYD